jgi:regulator of sigma E protease
LTASPGILTTVWSFLLVIGPLIFIHEMGHYLAGRWFGVKADAFSIGFGREVAGWTDKRGTRWKVGWMPLGGYVKFAGDMNPASQPSDEWLSLPAEERNRTFQAKPVWQRFIIVAAGPFVNFLFAILVFAFLFSAIGQPRTPNVVPGVAAGSAAERAGLQKGDRILALNGSAVERFEDIAGYVQIRPRQPIEVSFERGGQRRTVRIISDAETVSDKFGNKAEMGRLGVLWPDQIREKLAPHQAVWAGVRQTGVIVETMVVTLGQLVVGDRSVKELGGPLKIAQYSGQQATQGALDLVLFMTIISINLGFINLLPIPLLDGGHLLFYAIEGVRRKPLKAEAQEWAFRTGLAALLALMIFVTLNDLASFGVWKALGGLIG